MIKTLKVMVAVEIRADIDDEEQVREELKAALQEAIDDDELDYLPPEESDEEDF